MSAWDDIYNSRNHFIHGRRYQGTLIAAEKLPCARRGASGVTARLTFNVAGYRVDYLAASPCNHITLDECTRLKAALDALGWVEGQKVVELIGRPAWLKFGSDKSGNETVEQISGEVEV